MASHVAAAGPDGVFYRSVVPPFWRTDRLGLAISPTDIWRKSNFVSQSFFGFRLCSLEQVLLNYPELNGGVARGVGVDFAGRALSAGSINL